MQKLYEKSQLALALIMIGIYVLVTGFLDGISKYYTLLFHIILTGALVLFIVKHGHKREYGLVKSELPLRKALFYLPLFAVAAVNLFFGVRMNMPAGECAAYVLSMLFVGFLEEIIFRGMLFRAMEKDNLKSAVIVSGLTFGVGHMVNLVNGSGANLLANLCQVVYASAFGILCVILFLKSASLIACILTHSAVNALSAFSAAPETPAVEIGMAVYLTAVSVLYTVYLLKCVPGRKG